VFGYVCLVVCYKLPSLNGVGKVFKVCLCACFVPLFVGLFVGVSGVVLPLFIRVFVVCRILFWMCVYVCGACVFVFWFVFYSVVCFRLHKSQVPNTDTQGHSRMRLVSQRRCRGHMTKNKNLNCYK